MFKTNRYCDALKIEVPRLEAVVGHRQASMHSLLIVAILEQGGPMTLEEVAGRLEAAGAGRANDVLASLKKCRPARAPVYRDGERFALDPYDDELDLWVFRLGIRPPKVPRLQVVRGDPTPLPGPEQPLSIAELEEGLRGQHLTSNWSAQRMALAVLDAHGGPMSPQVVVAFADGLTQWHVLKVESSVYWRKGAAIRLRDDGKWEIEPNHPSLVSARTAVRERIAMARKWAGRRYDPVVAEASRRAYEARRAAHAAKLAALRRVVVAYFPASQPRALTLLDVEKREIETFMDGELDEAQRRLCEFDVVGAVGVRELLRALDIDPDTRRLNELGPPQKTVTIDARGRKLKLTTEMLIQGSCGIGKPLGDPAKMAGYLKKGQLTRLRDRLEADAKSLYALYSYGRVHGNVRLLWGGLDGTFVVPWLHRDEEALYGLMQRANELGKAMEVVVGNAPDWSEPWAAAEVCTVEPGRTPFDLVLVEWHGRLIDERDVQLARIAGE